METLVDNIIIILGKEDCEACEKAKNYFRNLGVQFLYIHFKDANIELKRHLTKEFKENNLPVTYPIILIPAEEGLYPFFGFSKKALDELFGVEG
jgi:glutaredoxin